MDVFYEENSEEKVLAPKFCAETFHLIHREEHMQNKLQIYCGSSLAMYSILIIQMWSQSETQDLLESKATRTAEVDTEALPCAGKHVWDAAFIIHLEISEGKDRRETGLLKSSPTGLQRVQKMRALRGE